MGRNGMGRNGYGPKWSWAEMHSAQPRMILNRSPSSDAGYGIIRGVPSGPKWLWAEMTSDRSKTFRA